MQVKRVPAALIGILLASVGVGRAQEVEYAGQPTDQLVFTMMRDLSGVVQATHRSRFEEEEFTLEIRGLAGRTGEVWWSRAARRLSAREWQCKRQVVLTFGGDRRGALLG